MRKISAQYIFPIASPPLKLGILVLNDDNSVAEVIDTKGKLAEAANIEFYNGIIVPGFVNAHCHIELSHMKGLIPPKIGLPSFLGQVSSMRNDTDEYTIINAMVNADKMMTKNGIVAVGDISNNITSISVKENSKINYLTFLEVFGFNPDSSDQILEEAFLKINQFIETSDLNASITPHAPYSVSKTLIKKINHKLSSKSSILSIHNQETPSENDFFTGQSGELFEFFNNRGILVYDWFPSNQTAVKNYFPLLDNASKILLVHNTFTSKEDIEFVKEQPQNTYWVLCPNSNMYIENTIPDIPLLRKFLKNIAIGTDSLASNSELSVLEELKTIQKNYPEVPLSELFTWATLNGAKALGLENKIGSIEKGKKPGINLLERINFDTLTFNEDSMIKVLA